MSTWRSEVLGWLARPAVVRAVTAPLRARAPVLRVGSTVVVLGPEPAGAALVDAHRLASGPIYDRLLPFRFVLGEDDAARHAAERAWVQRRLDDHADKALAEARRCAEAEVAGVADGLVDVAALARVVAATAVGHTVLGLDGVPVRTLATWSMLGFRLAFNGSVLDDRERRRARSALDAAHEAVRATATTFGDDLDDDAVVRTVRGLLIAANEVVQAAVGAVDVLLAEPALRIRAGRATRDGDDAALRAVVLAALERAPTLPALPRRAVAELRLGPVRVRPGDAVWVVLASALAGRGRVAADPAAATPGSLVFGQGRHACPARQVALGIVAEVVGALLGAGPFRRAPGAAGQVRRLGIEADRLVVVVGGAAPTTVASRQSGATVEVPVDPRRTGPVRAALAALADTVPSPFAELRDLHFASAVVLDPEPAPGAAPGEGSPSDRPGALLVELHVDGPAAPFLDELAERCAGPLTPVLEHGRGWPRPVGAPADAATVAAYLRDHDLGPGSLFTAWPGHTALDIRREAALWEEVSDHLCESTGTGVLREAEERVRLAADLVRVRPELSWVHVIPRRPRGAVLVTAGVRHLLRARDGLGAVRRRLPGPPPGGLAAALVPTGGPPGAADDGWEEAWCRREADIDLALASTEVVPACHHHLLSVTAVRPEWHRRAVLSVVRHLLRVGGAHLVVDGKLGVLDMVHAARWLPSRDGSRLYFFSNYDGTWADYLDEFIDRGAAWLNLVWWGTDNEVGFPPTRWVVGGGARDERRFKAYVRQSQRAPALWYESYPRVSVPAVGRNRALRRALAAGAATVPDDIW